jgi:hypothetical protein
VTSTKKKTQEGGKQKPEEPTLLLKTARINAVMKEEDPPFQKTKSEKVGHPRKRPKSKSLYFC